MSGWQTRSTREVYTNPWIRVVEDEVVRPDGSDGTYGVVEVRHPAVFVVPVTDDGQVVLVTMDRYTVGRESVEVPAGGSDGEDPLEAGRRELREETGYVADSWTPLGTQFGLNGVARAEMRVYLARGLRQAGGARLAEEGISDVSAHPWADVRRMLRDGTISDSESASALLLAAIELGWA